MPRAKKGKGKYLSESLDLYDGKEFGDYLWYNGQIRTQTSYKWKAARSFLEPLPQTRFLSFSLSHGGSYPNLTVTFLFQKLLRYLRRSLFLFFQFAAANLLSCGCCSFPSLSLSLCLSFTQPPTPALSGFLFPLLVFVFAVTESPSFLRCFSFTSSENRRLSISLSVSSSLFPKLQFLAVNPLSPKTPYLSSLLRLFRFFSFYIQSLNPKTISPYLQPKGLPSPLFASCGNTQLACRVSLFFFFFFFFELNNLINTEMIKYK